MCTEDVHKSFRFGNNVNRIRYYQNILGFLQGGHCGKFKNVNSTDRLINMWLVRTNVYVPATVWLCIHRMVLGLLVSICSVTVWHASGVVGLWLNTFLAGWVVHGPPAPRGGNALKCSDPLQIKALSSGHAYPGPWWPETPLSLGQVTLCTCGCHHGLLPCFLWHPQTYTCSWITCVVLTGYLCGYGSEIKA